MSRARDLASSGVTSTVLSAKAPLASPDFTGTVDLTGTTISLDNDQISGDKVSGGTIGAGTFNGTIGSSATGIPSQTFAYGNGNNTYSGSGPYTVKWNVSRDASGFTYGPNDNVDSTQIIPSSTGYYFINYIVNIFNEPPTGTEDDSGSINLNFAGSSIGVAWCHVNISSNPTSAHEGVSFSISRIYQVSSTGGSNYFDVTMTGFTLANYNETHWISILKIA